MQLIVHEFTWVSVARRTPALLGARAAGVGGEELRRVPGEEGGRGEHPELEADPGADGGGALQAVPRHPPGLHVRGGERVHICSANMKLASYL